MNPKDIAGNAKEQEELGCLMSQQHASVSQGRICSISCMCCHIAIEIADQICHLTRGGGGGGGGVCTEADMQVVPCYHLDIL